MESRLYFYEYHNDNSKFFYYIMCKVVNNEILRFDEIGIKRPLRKRLTEKTYLEYYKGLIGYEPCYIIIDYLSGWKYCSFYYIDENGVFFRC